MQTISVADIVVILCLVAVVVFIIRGMRKGSIRTCDSGSCGGNCAGCAGGCATPRIRLSREQKRQLEELRKGSVSEG